MPILKCRGRFEEEIKQILDVDFQLPISGMFQRRFRAQSALRNYMLIPFLPQHGFPIEINEWQIVSRFGGRISPSCEHSLRVPMHTEFFCHKVSQC